LVKSGSTKGALGFIGGILIIIAMFTSWLTGASKFLNTTISGFGVYSIAEININSVILPLMNAGILILVGGIVAVLVGGLMLSKVIVSSNYRIGFFLLLIAGAMSLIGFFIWIGSASNVNSGFGFSSNLFNNTTLSLGLWFALFGAILAILDGVLYLVTSRKSSTRSSSKSSRSKKSRSKK